MLSNAARKDPAMSGQLDYERIELDLYPTPPKFVRCLAEHFSLHGTDWWEPAAGLGAIAFAVEDITGVHVKQSDIHDHYPVGDSRLQFVGDFLDLRDSLVHSPVKALTLVPTGIITNPPFETVNLGEEEWEHLLPLAQSYGMSRALKKCSLAELFLRHSIELMKPVQGKVALFLRNEFDCGKGRMDLFKDHPAYAMKVICTERPRWIEGSTGSPRHSYSWFVFDWRHGGDATIKYSHPKTAKPLQF